MERALGVPGADGAPNVPPAADLGIEIDGTRYERQQLQGLIAAGRDYTAKTQALAEQTRQLQAQQAALAQVLPLIQPEIQKFQSVLEGSPMPPAELAQTDPTAYVQALARWQAAQAEIGRLGQMQQLQHQAQAQAMAQQVEAANVELAKEFPFWADPQQRGEIQQEIVRWALDQGGYTRDELRGLTNPKYLKTLMKAVQFDKWVGSATRTAAPASRTAAAPPRGVAPPPAATASVQAAEQAFAARPNVRNATALALAQRAGQRTNGA
jgi:hypothetical protein